MADFEDDDIPLSDDERALAERGRAAIAMAMADPHARAPRSLHGAVADARRPAAPEPRVSRPARRPRRWVLAPGLGVAALVTVALVVTLTGGEDLAAPSIEQIAVVARQPAGAAAPASIGGSPPLLAARVERLSFPDWQARYEWQAIGLRNDRVGGRAVTTVSYRYPGRATLGYAIVAGEPIKWGPGRDVNQDGARYRVHASAGRRTVTWTQAGHTCVIDAPSTVSAAELVRLASWA